MEILQGNSYKLVNVENIVLQSGEHGWKELFCDGMQKHNLLE